MQYHPTFTVIMIQSLQFVLQHHEHAKIPTLISGIPAKIKLPQRSKTPAVSSINPRKGSLQLQGDIDKLEVSAKPFKSNQKEDTSFTSGTELPRPRLATKHSLRSLFSSDSGGESDYEWLHPTHVNSAPEIRKQIDSKIWDSSDDDSINFMRSDPSLIPRKETAQEHTNKYWLDLIFDAIEEGDIDLVMYRLHLDDDDNYYSKDKCHPLCQVNVYFS